VDHDVCTARTLWSPITAASADSTLAGLLAGLLIAAAAALLIQWHKGAGSTIALFGSGVPALMLSTYLFTVIAGVDYPEKIDHKTVDYETPGAQGDNLCSQLWSEWLLAIGLLWIGSAILVCGLGWLLVSYANDDALKLCKRHFPIKTVALRRGTLIRLNAWLSSAAIIAATTMLMVTSVIYVNAVGSPDLSREFLGVKWYLLFFIYLFGLYLIGRSSYVVFSRTRSAMRANKKSCAAYAAGGPPVTTDDEGIKAGVGPVRLPAAKDPRFARRNDAAMRVAQEFVGIILVALGAFLAVYMTSGEAFGQPRAGIAVSPKIIIYVVVFYVIVRAIYLLIEGIFELVSAKKNDTPTNGEAVPPSNAEFVESIRMNYSVGMLRLTTYNVVLLAILGTIFVAALTQGPLWPLPRISISLFLGGLYPAVVLTELSSSVPAADDVRLPKWEVWIDRSFQ
jgi:hypothetical protein